MSVNEIVVKTPISSAMGASMVITGPGEGLYLVIGNDMLPQSLIYNADGKVILRLSERKILAVLPFSGYLSLANDYRVSHIGPVTVDLKRLTKMAELISKSA